MRKKNNEDVGLNALDAVNAAADATDCGCGAKKIKKRMESVLLQQEDLYAPAPSVSQAAEIPVLSVRMARLKSATRPKDEDTTLRMWDDKDQEEEDVDEALGDYVTTNVMKPLAKIGKYVPGQIGQASAAADHTFTQIKKAKSFGDRVRAAGTGISNIVGAHQEDYEQRIPTQLPSEYETKRVPYATPTANPSPRIKRRST